MKNKKFRNKKVLKIDNDVMHDIWNLLMYNV